MPCRIIIFSDNISLFRCIAMLLLKFQIIFVQLFIVVFEFILHRILFLSFIDLTTRLYSYWTNLPDLSHHQYSVWALFHNFIVRLSFFWWYFSFLMPLFRIYASNSFYPWSILHNFSAIFRFKSKYSLGAAPEYQDDFNKLWRLLSHLLHVLLPFLLLIAQLI